MINFNNLTISVFSVSVFCFFLNCYETCGLIEVLRIHLLQFLGVSSCFRLSLYLNYWSLMY